MEGHQTRPNLKLWYASRQRVGIEDPRWPFDNVPPMVQISLANAALATSGTGRRGFVVGGVKYGHVIDPRTGIPVDHVLSASVVAPDAVTAGALATAAMVLAPDAVSYTHLTLPTILLV